MKSITPRWSCRRVSITRNTIVVPFRRACMFPPFTERRLCLTVSRPIQRLQSYAGEPLFQILAPNIDTERLSKQLNRLQNSLGRLNDLQTITPYLARVRTHVQGRSRRNFEAAEHFCRGWSAAAAANLVDHAEEAMRGFERIQLDASA